MTSTRARVEKKVAETILQQPIELEIGGRKYSAAPPSIATLILASEAAAELPRLDFGGLSSAALKSRKSEDITRFIQSVVREAKHCRAVGRIVAVLILGAKRVGERVGVRHRWWQLWKIGRKEYRVDALAREVLLDLQPSEVAALVVPLLARMQLGDFFECTTFLNEINVLKPTRGVDTMTEATVSGQ